jgi:signal transduction histidine kinase
VRHRALLTALWIHVPALFVFGLANHKTVRHMLFEAGIVAAIAATVTFLPIVKANRDASTALVSIGLLTCSAILIHLSGGFIELHFHFFVVVVALTLYEDWVPFLVAAAYVALHHGIMGTIDPKSVYNHPAAQTHPWRWALIHAGFIAAAGAAAVCAWRLNEDIREEHQVALERAIQAERAQAAAVRELERSNADLQQFAYVASHDLSEPLRTVSGFMQLLQRRYGDKLDADAEEFIGYAVSGAQRMQQLIEDLLSWSRVGSAELQVEPVDLESVAADAVLALHAPIERAGADVQLGELPRVEGDGRQLAQLLQNLISNGVKFAHPDRPPVVRLDAERSAGCWLVSVTDNGVGLDPADADRAFKMFSRLHHTDGYQGTGIGLAICQRIVERHGGRIWVERPRGDGSSFRFTLPDGGVRAERDHSEPAEEAGRTS